MKDKILWERLDEHVAKKKLMVVNWNLIQGDYWMDWVEEEVGMWELNWHVF